MSEMERVVQAVVAATGVSEEEIRGHGRVRRVADARRLAIWLGARLHPRLNQGEIAGHLGVHRTYVRHAVRVHDSLRSIYRDICGATERAMERLADNWRTTEKPTEI